MAKLFVVSTPIGNLGDMTTRAIETLKTVDYILCEDTRTSLPLLKKFEIQNKTISYHKFNEIARSKEIIASMLENDENVAIITDAGTPCISDPGFYIIDEARNHNIEVVTVPGASAVISALAISGFEVNEFAFYGFFPRILKEQKELIKKIKKSKIPLSVIYESPNRIIKSLKNIEKELPNCRLLVCNDLTKKFEKSIRGKINDIIEDLENNPNTTLGEYVIVIENFVFEEAQSDNSFLLESEIIKDLLTNGGTTKDSIQRLTEKYDKNALYKASLNLKKIL